MKSMSHVHFMRFRRSGSVIAIQLIRWHAAHVLNWILSSLEKKRFAVAVYLLMIEQKHHH